MNSFGKVIATLALLVFGLVGLGMSLCGGVFTIASLGEGEMTGTLAMSVPSLAVGAALVWVAVRGVRKRLAKPT